MLSLDDNIFCRKNEATFHLVNCLMINMINHVKFNLYLDILILCFYAYHLYIELVTYNKQLVMCVQRNCWDIF